MSLFDPNNADPDWQRLFGEAADTPPPRVWQAIERELDDETDAFVPIIPFWQRSIFLRVAAAILVLLAGGLLVLWPVEKEAVVAKNAAKTRQNSRLSTNYVDNNQKSGQNVDNLSDLQPEQEKSTSADAEYQTGSNRHPMLASRAYSINKTTVPIHINNKVSIKQNRKPRTGHQATNERIIESVPALLPTVSVPEIAQTKSPEFIAINQVLHQSLRVDVLPSPTWATVITVAAHEPVIEPQQPASSAKPRGRWLSVSAGQAAFQPSVALRSQSASAASGVVKGSVSVPDQLLESRSGAAVSVLAVAGFHLSGRWFVEGGAGFQQAQATVVSPGQVASAFTATNVSSSSVYNDALFGSSSASQNNGIQINRTNSALFDNRNQVGQANEQRSIYQFGQAMAQVGYQFRPRKRLGIAALGGLIANLFVKNAVENGPVIRATNAVYRPVSIAGLGGLRLRYRASGRWSVSMAGLYQYSLSSITQSSALLSVQPQNVSISGSLDYHF